ncbi:MAG: Survival protein SurA precursor (Peptidyl-prolyl cis-trans isomerase SurA) [Rhodanobacteraceae bacterium]|jgi:peptidyl-prolyl cis-trans isomerase SurA|nr:MAG: Survival protein SurA precursor (Peptidyl-prolyl cis-trans isomerase SurA) [Rhodanobacteraceae bacterium]
MNRSRLARLALALASCAFALPAFAQLLNPNTPPTSGAPSSLPSLVSNQPQPLDRIIAVVNDGVILQSQLDQTMATVAHQIQASGGKLPPQNVLEKQVLQRLILNQLLVQKARDNGVRVSDDQVDAAVANIAQQNKMTVPQMQAAMQQEGVDYASFRQQLRDQLLVRAVQQQVMQSNAQVSDAEIDNLIASPAFKQGEVHLARILVGLPEGADAKQIAAAQAKADKIESELKAGKSFAALAVSDSSAPEALDGGDLGWRRVDELPPAVQQIVNSLPEGGYTEPLRDASGFTILKLEGKRTPDTKQIVTEYHALHLMIKPTAVLSEQGAKDKIEKLYQEIVSGHADFAALAKQYSDDPTTANAGGDMGWFMQGDWGSEVGKLIAGMQPNQVTQPFESPDGSWHIVKLLGTRQADKTRDIEREQARQAIAARKGQQAYEQFLRDLESSAYISIRVPELADDSSVAGGGMQ